MNKTHGVQTVFVPYGFLSNAFTCKSSLSDQQSSSFFLLENRAKQRGSDKDTCCDF